MLDKVKGKNGGWLARFPSHTVTPSMDGYWEANLEYLLEFHPNNKQGIRKATKMINRN